MILQGKTAVVVGGGQTPGATIGNGRATAMQFAREGAEVLVADRDLASAGETVVMIEDEGGRASACHVDVTEEASLQELSREVLRRYGKVDVLHNNVGMSLAAGDAAVEDITTDAIVNISSMAAWRPYPYVAYKATKAAVVAFTEQLAQTNARYNIRANVILPGLMNTPMAIESRVAAGTPRERCFRTRQARAARQKDGLGLGRRARGGFSRIGSCRIHHRRGTACGRRVERKLTLSVWLSTSEGRYGANTNNRTRRP